MQRGNRTAALMSRPNRKRGAPHAAVFRGAVIVLGFAVRANVTSPMYWCRAPDQPLSQSLQRNSETHDSHTSSFVSFRFHWLNRRGSVIAADRRPAVARQVYVVVPDKLHDPFLSRGSTQRRPPIPRRLRDFASRSADGRESSAPT
jgi:hypothetical protein